MSRSTPVIELGWAAPSFAQQFPALSKEDAERFDADSKAISRLAIQGLITRAERDKAAMRLAQNVGRALAAPSDPSPGAGCKTDTIKQET